MDDLDVVEILRVNDNNEYVHPQAAEVCAAEVLRLRAERDQYKTVIASLINLLPDEHLETLRRMLEAVDRKGTT